MDIDHNAAAPENCPFLTACAFGALEDAIHADGNLSREKKSVVGCREATRPDLNEDGSLVDSLALCSCIAAEVRVPCIVETLKTEGTE